MVSYPIWKYVIEDLYQYVIYLWIVISEFKILMQKQDIGILLILHFQRLTGIVIFHHYSILWLVRWYLVCYITMIHGQWLRIMIQELGISWNIKAWFGNFSNRCVQFLIRCAGCTAATNWSAECALDMKLWSSKTLFVSKFGTVDKYVHSNKLSRKLYVDFFQEYPTDQWFLPVFGFRTLELRECRRVR